MKKVLSQIFSQFREFVQGLTPVRKSILIASSAIVLIAGISLLFFLKRNDMSVLLSNVPSEQMPLVLGVLNEKRIPFEMGKDGQTVLIPRDLIPAVQMSLMSEIGSENLGNIGFEIFDKRDFSLSQYQQRVNYQRALQGELTRAISTLLAVKKAKVILAIPQKKNFLESQNEPSASVVLELHAGKDLSSDQIRGIQYLVSSAVENLKPEKVTVVNHLGKLLTRNEDTLGQGSLELIDLKRKIEGDLENRLLDILGRVTGTGKLIAKVDVKLNPQVITKTVEDFDGERSARRSEQLESESLDGSKFNPSGAPGVTSNIPDVDRAPQSVGLKQDIKREVKNIAYEIPRTIQSVRKPAGEIERISAAIILDGEWIEEKKDDGTTMKVFKAKSDEELKKLAELVKSAIGFNEARGDTLKIESLPFSSVDFEESEKLATALERKKLLSLLLRWAFLGLAVLLFLFFVVRPFLRWINDSFQSSVDEVLPKTIMEIENSLSSEAQIWPRDMSENIPIINESIDPIKAESELLRDRILSMIGQNEHKASAALSLWVTKRD